MDNSQQDTAVALRKRLKQLRAAMDPEARDRGGLLIRGRLYTWLATTRARLREAGRPAPSRIAAFWPMQEEPELRPLLQQWAADEELTLSLPVVTGSDAPLEFRLWTPDTPMHEGAYRILEPQAEQAEPPDLILVPTLGYTRQGDRVGYGKGYYDRTLAALKAAGHAYTSIGVAWACGDLSGQPYAPAAHDMRLDAILTDKGWAVSAPVL